MQVPKKFSHKIGDTKRGVGVRKLFTGGGLTGPGEGVKLWIVIWTEQVIDSSL